MLTEGEAGKNSKAVAVILLLAKLMALPLAIGYYEHLKIYSPWAMLAIKAGSSFGVYVMTKIFHTIH